MIADSLILLVIGSLIAFYRYLQFKTQPVAIEKEVPREIAEINKQIEKLKLDKEVAMLNYDIYKLHASAVTVKSREAESKKPFTF